MSDPVFDAIAGWAAEGCAVAVATVIATRRSSPRPVGSKLALNDRGELAGAVSGGCVEGAVLEVAEQTLSSGERRVLQFGPADEFTDIGLPCDGEITVLVERYGGSLARFVAAALVGRGASRTVVLPDGDLFVDTVAPLPRLVVVGAGDVTVPLTAFASEAGWRPFVVDPRRRFAEPGRFPCAEAVLSAWPDKAFASLGPFDADTAVAVLTHDIKLDDAAVVAALRMGAGYIGAMGSRKAVAARTERLLALGVPASALAAVRSPIGLDIGGSTAAETALSIIAGLVAFRSGRDGGRLVDAAGPIHNGGAPVHPRSLSCPAQ